MATEKKYTLGTVEASEQLLKDLYLDLREKIAQWAQLTHQTAQARMGYVGQHLVSVATGLPGGKSGARGHDLIHPEKETYSEIKTCYRVDQLGNCEDCGERITTLEDNCPACSSTNINRMDDSKWLIGIRHDAEYDGILSPKYYFLVLFDLVDRQDPNLIRVGIWTVEPTRPGFAYCMIDYYGNIRAGSKSKAPFNLWPFQLKFCLMEPVLIYESILNVAKKAVDTRIFPGRDKPQPYMLGSLPKYSGSRNLTREVVLDVGKMLGLRMRDTGARKVELLITLQQWVKEREISNGVLADSIAKAMYGDKIAPHLKSLPAKIRAALAAT